MIIDIALEQPADCVFFELDQCGEVVDAYELSDLFGDGEISFESSNWI